MADMSQSPLEFKKRFSVDNGSNFQFKANIAIKQLINYDNDKVKVRNSYRTSNIDRNSLTSLAIPRPKTKFELIVENLKDILMKFDLQGKANFKEKIEQIIYELISNSMYSYDESNGQNSDEIQFLKQYTSNCQLDEKLMDRSDTSLYKATTNNFKNSIICGRSQLIEINKFGVNFDVFSYAETYGKRNMFMNITNSALTYRDVNKLLKNTYLNNYLEKIWEGYNSQSEAFYHNVKSS